MSSVLFFQNSFAEPTGRRYNFDIAMSGERVDRARVRRWIDLRFFPPFLPLGRMDRWQVRKFRPFRSMAAARAALLLY
jgi:hypothetical protein